MPEHIVKFKAETSGFDASLKKSTNEFIRQAEAAQKAGASLAYADKEEIAVARSLGKLELSARSARGKISELSNSFVELRTMYGRLSDKEKQSDFGKALNKSLEELRGRLDSAKSEMADVNREMNGSQGVLDSLSSKFGVNIKSLTAWGAALGAGKVALDVIKDAFFASEANLDDWNRTVYASESAWDGFLTSINTGDISGYLSRIDEIVSAAKTAYNEMDRLSTQKAIDNPVIKAQETENERMRAMLRTGRYIAPNDGRKASMKEGQVLTDAQKQKISAMLENGMKKLNSYVRSEIDQTTKTIDSLYTEQAKGLGMSLSEFRNGTANMGAFDARMAGYKKYQDYEAKRSIALSKANSGIAISDSESAYIKNKNPYQSYKAWGVFKDDGELFTKINDYINQRAALQNQNYSNTAQAYKAIDKALKSASGTTGKTVKEVYNPLEGSIDYYQKLANDASKAINQAATEEARRSAQLLYDEYSSKVKELKGDSQSYSELRNGKVGVSIMSGALVDTSYDFSGKAPTLGKIKLPEREKKGLESKEYKASKEMLAGIQSIDSGLKGLGIDMGSGVDKMLSVAGSIFTVVEGVNAVVTAINLLSSSRDTAYQATVVSELGAIATSTAITASTNAIPFFAGGGVVKAAQGFSGVVPGRSWSGDNVPIMANSGEVVLNKAQAGNLASQLATGGETASGGTPYLTGETLYCGVNNHLKRTGQGEIVTTRMLRNKGVI